jgi:hypothetical protein
MAEAEVDGGGLTASVRGLLLSVAVFAGLSGRPDLLGLLLVYLLASLSERLGCHASWLCPGENELKRETGLTRLEPVASALKGR